MAVGTRSPTHEKEVRARRPSKVATRPAQLVPESPEGGGKLTEEPKPAKKKKVSKQQKEGLALRGIYEEDACANSEESLRKLQGLLLQVENLVPALPADDPEANVTTPVVVNAEKVQGQVARSLLGCISTVLGRGAQLKLQERLQALVLSHSKPGGKEVVGNPLPLSMTSPRSAIHVQDRLRHFETLRREVDMTHYMHDREVPWEIRTTQEDGPSTPNPQGRLALIQQLRQTQSPARVLSAGRQRTSRESREQQPRPRSSPTSCGRPSSGCLSELSKKVKLIESDMQVCDVQPVERGQSYWESEAQRDEASPTAGTASSRPGSATAGTRSKVAVQLTGITSGFMQAKSEDVPQDSDSRVLVQYPRRSRPKALAAAKQVNAEEQPEVVPRSLPKAVQRPAPREVDSEEEIPGKVTDQELLDISSRIRGERWAHGLSMTDAAQRRLLTAVASQRPASRPATGRSTRWTMSSPQPLGKGQSKDKHSLPAAEPNSTANTTSGRARPKGRPQEHIEAVVGRLLQKRGLERATTVPQMDLEKEDLRSAAAAAARSAAARKARAGAGAGRSGSATRGRPWSAPQPLVGTAEAAQSAARPGSPGGAEEVTIVPNKPWGWTSEVGYMRGCLQGKVFPRLVKIFVDKSPKLDLAAQFLVDGELEAVLRAIQAPPQPDQDNGMRKHPISELSLANNPNLSDLTVARFLHAAVSPLGDQPCLGPLKRLSLASCTGLGEMAIGTLADLLGKDSELGQLEELDLSNVPVPAASWPPLTTGLGCARSLRKLLLAHTGCGRHSQATCVAFAELISTRALACLEVLDVGGNHFLHEGCRALGRALRRSTDSLRHLDLSHNASLKSVLLMQDVESNPIAHVLEALGETMLEKAAFANCQLAYKEDLVLEASVTSSEISDLDVSDNPHGETGLRCLVRLLTASGRRLKILRLDSVRLHPTSGLLTFDFANPSACYKLQLENVQHRSVLRLLLQRGEDVTGNSACSSFRQEQYNNKSLGVEGMLELCSKRRDRNGWLVPETGLLTFTFLTPSIYEEGEEIGRIYMKFQRRSKICLNFAGFRRLLQVYKGLVDKRSKQLFLEAMSRDLCLKFCQVKHLGMISEDLLSYVLCSLLPETTQLPLRSALFDLVACCSKGWPESIPMKIASECRNLVFHNFVHADGHYELMLDRPSDRATAQRCIVAARWIKAYGESKGLLDISEHGDWECLWHVVHGSQTIRGACTEWQLQDTGLLVFDFVLPRLRFGKQGPIEEAATMEALGKAFKESPCKFSDRLHALRLIAHELVLSPAQLSEALEWFPRWCPKYALAAYTDYGAAPPVLPRAEAYFTLYNRTLHHSEVVSPKLLYNPSVLHPEEALLLRGRLGLMHTVDLVNVHNQSSNLGNRHGPMDLTTWDGFIMLKAILAISKEEASVNFHDGWWSDQISFYERGFAFILPASWHLEPPRTGSFTTTFASKDDEVNYGHRRQVARRLLGWTFPEGDEWRPPSPQAHEAALLRRASTLDFGFYAAGDSPSANDLDLDGTGGLDDSR